MIASTTFAGRQVGVVGMARSGLAAAKSLTAGGAIVGAWDDSERGRAAAVAAGLTLVDLTSADLAPYAAIVLSPGVPLTDPKPLPKVVTRARAAGVPLIGDTELFFRELFTLPEAARPKVIGITGTNGKSTTTALIAHILRHAGKRVAMGGNIGEAVLGLSPFGQTDIYVLELSSYQIDLTPSVRPDAGILLNLTPDHLNRHGSMEHYAAVKERLVAGAKVAIVGLDDPWCRAIAGPQRRSRRADLRYPCRNRPDAARWRCRLGRCRGIRDAHGPSDHRECGGIHQRPALRRAEPGSGADIARSA